MIFHGYFRGFLGSFLVSQKNGVNFMVKTSMGELHGEFPIGIYPIGDFRSHGGFLLSDGILVGGLVAIFYFSHILGF